MQQKFYYKSKIGILEFCIEDNALISLSLTNKISIESKETPISQKIKTQLDEYFSFQRQVFDIKISPKGTDFQKRVWSELQKIPYGQTTSYCEIAQKLGNKNSSRAVGNACNKNPIMLLIPCHRIISKTGKLSGFACGVDIKQKLLNLENQKTT